MAKGNQSNRGGSRPGAGRPKGARDKLGGRHTDGTRMAMTLDYLTRSTGSSITDIAKATFAAPGGNANVDEAHLRSASNLVSQRRKKWKEQLEQGPCQHPGYLEVMRADMRDLAPPPLCPGGEDCPNQVPFWRMHWHCEDCRASQNFLGPPPSIVRWVGQGEGGQLEGMRFIFRGWVCGKCLEKPRQEQGEAPPADRQSS